MELPSIARKIRELRTALGSAGRPITGAIFADMVGTTQATISRWEKGVDRPKPKNIEALAKLAKQTVGEFLYGQQIGVPVISWVSAGALQAAESVDSALPDDVERIAVSGLGAGDFFALRVAGDSMNKVAPEDSIIIINRADREVIDRKFYVFDVEGETTFKRYRANPNRLEPYSFNPDHESIYPEGDFGIIGRVKMVLIDEL